jgi:2-polyprenyl-3-methyl-5-hydroxy-6-metoxy-1,4-benzoquinol methylase
MSRPRAKDSVAWHDRIAERFADRYQHSAMFKERRQMWQSVLESHVTPGATVLDLGCGNGIFAVIAANIARQVIAIDGSEAMIALARETARKAQAVNIEFFVHRLEEFPAIVQRPVDSIVCSSVIEYMANPDAFLESCATALRPGGKILLSAPNGDCWYRKFERNVFRIFGVPRYYAYVRTVERPVDTASRLSRAGFHATEVRHFGVLPFLPSVLRRLPNEVANTLTLFVATKRVH